MSLSEKTTEAPAVTQVSGMCKALERVLGAVPQGDSKENAPSQSAALEQHPASPTQKCPDPHKQHDAITPTGKKHFLKLSIWKCPEKVLQVPDTWTCKLEFGTSLALVN